MPIRVMRAYHGGRNRAHRARERALAAHDIELTLVVPADWPEGGSDGSIPPEPFRVVELPVRRAGDVNRHTYSGRQELRKLVASVSPDVLDVHEEPFSLASRQWLAAAPAELPVVMYTAQNVDKRYPPPFAQYERAAHHRVSALYPCSRQAASVARGKGFDGIVEVLPLGYDDSLFFVGSQSLDDEELVLALFGRLVAEKGVLDAVRVLARVNAHRRARLVLVGSGPGAAPTLELATSLGIRDRVLIEPWRSATDVAGICRQAHVVLVPSVPTQTWTEQFGRVIVEGHACGAVVAGYASGTIPEVSNGVAELVAPGDIDSLAERVVRLTSSPEIWGELRKRGLELSQTRTWARVSERQAELYHLVVGAHVPRLELARSPAGRRLDARAEFGPTASLGDERPFAIPLLRRSGPLSRALAAVVDAGGELAARARG